MRFYHLQLQINVDQESLSYSHIFSFKHKELNSQLFILCLKDFFVSLYVLKISHKAVE